ncbi:MAG: hypothetical protein HQL31_01285 [Planctomycetes bacterium]|nr:hypothetical protein [Planctomycetota bacterium]
MRFSERIHDVGATLTSKYIVGEGFLGAVEETYEYLNQYPEQVEFKLDFDIDQKIENLKQEDVLFSVMDHLCHNLRFFLFTNVYKMHSYIASLISAVNRPHLVSSALYVRNIVECTAVFNYYYRKYDPIMSRAVHFKSIDEYIECVVDLSNIFKDYRNRTRFDWKSLLEGDMVSLGNAHLKQQRISEDERQVNIMTMIEKIGGDKESARFFYSYISELVHPNKGSQFLLIDRVIKNNDGTIHGFLKRDRIDDEGALVVFFTATALPLKIHCSNFKVIAEEFKQGLTCFEETIQSFQQEWKKRL